MPDMISDTSPDIDRANKIHRGWLLTSCIALVLGLASIFCILIFWSAIPAVLLAATVLVFAGQEIDRRVPRRIAWCAIGWGVAGITVTFLLPVITPLFMPQYERQSIKASRDLRLILQGLTVQAGENGDEFPTITIGWQQALVDGDFVEARKFTSPFSDGIGADYFFVPGGRNDYDSSRVLVYEDPFLREDGTLIGYGDAHVEWIPQKMALEILDALTLPDGRPWAPHRDQAETGSVP